MWLIIGGIAFGSYLAVHLLLLNYPQLVWKKAKGPNQYFDQLMSSDKKIVVGHRGGAFEGPQSTMQLFKQNETHVDMFEFDICTTKDSNIVINHDENLERTCGLNKQITEVNFDELPQMKQKYLAYGEEGLEIQTHRNRLPLLTEMWKTFPNKPLMIEVKTFNQTMLQKLTDLTKQFKRDEFTVFGYNGSGNTAINQMTKQTLTFYTQRELVNVFVSTLLGLTHFTSLRPGVILIPLVDQGYQYETRRESSSSLQALKIIYGSKFLQFTSRYVVPYLRHRGIPSIVFNADTPENIKWSMAGQAVGIMSNRPKEVRLELDRKGLHFVFQDKSQ